MRISLRIVHVLVGQFETRCDNVAENSMFCAARAAAASEDVANVLDEAEIEHAVGLVEHHDLTLAQAKTVLLEVVDQAPGVPISTSTHPRAACAVCHNLRAAETSAEA